MSIKIEPNKHIALLLEARSGSSLLRQYLSEITGYYDLSELFNHRVKRVDISVDNEVHITYPPDGGSTLETEVEVCNRSKNYLDQLDQLTILNKYSVFGVVINSYQTSFPELTQLLSVRTDIQPIRIERADLLYSFLSIAVSRKSDVWHNRTYENGTIAVNRDVAPITLPISWIEHMLNTYICSVNEIRKNFRDVPLIYYEQFQRTPATLMHLFTGIPEKIINHELNKFVGNYKELITNLSEVEDYYEQYVHSHSEYFPQYFDNTLGITIPISQGRQPRNLLSLSNVS